MLKGGGDDGGVSLANGAGDGKGKAEGAVKQEAVKEEGTDKENSLSRRQAERQARKALTGFDPLDILKGVSGLLDWCRMDVFGEAFVFGTERDGTRRDGGRCVGVFMGIFSCFFLWEGSTAVISYGEANLTLILL